MESENIEIPTKKDKKENGSSVSESKNENNLIYIFLLFGAGLVGLGVLGFIIKDWGIFSGIEKLLILIISMVVLCGASLGLESKYPKTARSFVYINLIVFLASLGLLEQIGLMLLSTKGILLIYSIGVFVVGLILKDNLILTFGLFPLMFISDNNLNMIWILPLLYIFLKFLEKNFVYQLYVFFLNVLALKTVSSCITEFFLNINVQNAFWDTYTLIFIGLLMAILPLPDSMKKITRIQGNLLHGFLTLFYIMDFTLVMTILYVIALIYIIKQGSKTGIAILVMVTLYYYWNYLSLMNLNIATLLVVIGLSSIGVGLVFEIVRRRRKGNKDEE